MNSLEDGPAGIILGTVIILMFAAAMFQDAREFVAGPTESTQGRQAISSPCACEAEALILRNKVELLEKQLAQCQAALPRRKP